MRPRLWTAIALATVVAVPAMAQGATVSGTVKGGKGMKISAIGLDGTATTGTIKSNGSFKLSVPSSRAKNATLHLISSNGDYYGPVVIARSKAKTTGYMRLNNKTVNLGNISKKSGFALVGTAPASGTYSTKAGTVKVAKKTGAPMGAGKLGLVKVATSSSELARKGEMQSGSGSGSGGGNGTGGGSGSSGGQQFSPTDPCGTAVGGDCDKDGVPNAFDVDDNGNLTIDMTDAVSVASTAKLLTYSDVRPSIGNTVNANAGATPEQINAFLGSTSTTTPTGLALTFYYSSQDLIGTSSGTLTSVWATCGTGAPWCAPGTGTATVSGFSEYPQILPDVAAFGSVSWGTYTGSTCAAQGQPCQPSSTPSPGNGFQSSSQQGAPAGSSVWTAFTKPNAADTLGTVNADSVLTLNYRGNGVTQSQKPIAISPYFVTTPAITNVVTGAMNRALSYPYTANEGTSRSNGFQLGADGNLALTLWRPQRLGLPGETSQFYDVGGLHYGLTLDSISTAANPNGEQRASQEVGCALTAVNGLGGNSPALDGLWNAITPLQDTTLTDQVPNPANTVSLSGNILACAQGAFPGVNLAGGSANLSLLAIGQPLSHGANRTGVSFTVKFAGGVS